MQVNGIRARDMSLMLGIDTGGTYTDAVLLRDEKQVIAKAKSLTTRHDLSIGVGNAIARVLSDSDAPTSDIVLVSLSTTLATNALVEGQGGRVALVSMGFEQRDLERQGLSEALKGDPVLRIAGGHNHAGGESARFDEAGLREWLRYYGGGVSGFAVAGAFATRNPAHEIAAQKVIAEVTGKPVSCSHDLSAKLNGPKRAMTAVLNARLIGMIGSLITAAETLMAKHGIDAPLMVVRGDGALISAKLARQKPIETILSGPAASIVGASWLTGEAEALVSDIGGTTTDIALLRGGKPMIDPAGARVGGHRTMVEAVAMRTSGLGGDSEVHLSDQGLKGGLFLGPRRVMPVSLLATDWPDLVQKVLDQQLSAETNLESDGRFVVPIRRDASGLAGISEREAALFARIGEQARALSGLLISRMEVAALNRLVERGLVMISALTPSDASHALGRMAEWDVAAARKAVELFGRRRIGSGDRLGSDIASLAQVILDQLTEQTATSLLEAAFDEDTKFAGDPASLARHELLLRGLENHSGLVATDIRLNVPVIGLGASAHAYYPAVGERLRCPMQVPEHAEVANALGAVVGQISMTRQASITMPSNGVYRAHLPDSIQDFTTETDALSEVEDALTHAATRAARDAGAENLRVKVDRDIKRTGEGGPNDFLEATLAVTASGRPRIASD